jgi:hypothetical protein
VSVVTQLFLPTTLNSLYLCRDESSKGLAPRATSPVLMSSPYELPGLDSHPGRMGLRFRPGSIVQPRLSAPSEEEETERARHEPPKPSKGYTEVSETQVVGSENASNLDMLKMPKEISSLPSRVDLRSRTLLVGRHDLI